MKTVIYFLRHGEVHNPTKILYARLSRFRLSDTGQGAIHDVAKELKVKGVDRIYSSPLLRARQTARIVGAYVGAEPKVSRLLLETDLHMAGIPLEKFRGKIQSEMYTPKYLNKGQESIDSQSKRMLAFVIRMKRFHGGLRILAVSHGDPIVILKATIEGKPFSTEFKMKNYIRTGEYITLVCENNTYRWV